MRLITVVMVKVTMAVIVTTMVRMKVTSKVTPTVMLMLVL